MAKHIDITAYAVCKDPAELTEAQRACMITYKDEAACLEDHRKAIQEDQEEQVRCFGQVDYNPAEFIRAREPHAVLQTTTHGYLLRHNPREDGSYLDCPIEDRARLVDQLGGDNEWIATRYGSQNSTILIRGFE